ncbi:MAG TPA: right-handed parallel beta-helix repeat-containing protein [Mycobacteriales bacterium]|nr:right-handed parallel beta-helix repeat-containing protein [Mycobacteriales bacterium]
MRVRPSRLLSAVLAGCVLALSAGTAALAHEERDSEFPDGSGSVPEHRPFDESTPHVVVCKPGSRRAIALMPAGPVRTLNEALVDRCRFQHIQAAVDHVEKNGVRGTNIYVLPGLYREEPSWDENAPCTDDYDDGVVDYPLIVSCGEVINLVTIAGDSTVDTREVDCNALCDLQIEGTGMRMEDVVLHGGFKESGPEKGDWIKHNGMKADRADGFVVRNMTFEVFRENALYVHETDGYLIDRVNTRHNDLYGILTFTSDHGVISNCDASYNGDSGIYPGSAADVNADNDKTGPLTRWAVEIFGCKSHHNALGFSGSAGNSVYFHDNDVFQNQAGYVTDSFVADHPGMPQDHAWLTGNRIFANNNNYVKQFVQGDDAPCRREKPADRGIGQGTVCPAFPVPVGTGILIAGGNHNFVDQNLIYDNWRAGAKLLWVPAAIRGEVAADQYDTSNDNHFTHNRLGFHPAGVTQPNGLDFEWDEQGLGNCWQGNVPATGTVTSDVLVHPGGLPDCDSGGSVLKTGYTLKTAMMASCATYNRDDEPDPPGCDWFDSPAEPAGRQAAPGEGGEPPAGSGDGTTPPAGGGGSQPTTTTPVAASRTLPATGAALLPAAAGLLLAGTVLYLRRRNGAVS